MTDEQTGQTLSVLNLIPPNKKENWGKSGTVQPCPRCGGQVDWARVKSNGHVRIACRTPNCIQMMS